MRKLHSKVERVRKIEQFVQFSALASNNKGNSSHRKPQNCWVTKTLMSPYIPRCKVSSFSKIISAKLFGISSSNFHSQLILLLYALSIFRKFIVIAWSENETHMLKRLKKNVHRDSHSLKHGRSVAGEGPYFEARSLLLSISPWLTKKLLSTFYVWYLDPV